MTTAVPDPLDRIAPWSRPGCNYPGCKTQATVTLDRLEQVDPLAAFRLARAWFAWHADERFLAAAERLAAA